MKLTVLVPLRKPAAPTLLVQLPPTLWLKLPAVQLPPLMSRVLAMVHAPVEVTAPLIVRL